MTKRRSAGPAESAAEEVDPAFAAVADRFAGDPRVTYGKMMASPGLKVDGKIFAMLARGRFVAKLPRQRVDALIAAGDGERFDPGHGRVMETTRAGADWLALAREAYQFVSGDG